MHAPSDVTFVERDGPDAETSLTRLQARLDLAGMTSRLLRSHDRPDLRLLVVEGAARLEDDDVRGARVWRFVDADPGDADADASTPPGTTPGTTPGTPAGEGGTAS